MGGYSMLGFSGGLDVQGLVSQILFAEQAPIRQIDSKISNYQAKVKGYNDLNSRLSSLLAEMDTLSREESFAARKTTSSSESVITASADSSAFEGTYQITVQRLALWDNFVSDASFTETSGAIGTGSFDLTVGDETTTITIDSTNSTLDGLRLAINSSGADVNASIVHDGSGYRLTVTSKSSGSENAISVSNNTLTLADGSTPLTLSRTHDIADASELDAALNVNGLAVTSSSNQVEDVISGVTLNLKNISASTVTIQVANDTEAVKSSIQGFVEAYNQVYSYINTQFQYVEGAGSSRMAGESILRDVQSQLSSIVGSQVTGLGGAMTTLAELGVTMKNDGTLTVDSAVLDENLSSNFDAIKDLFVGQGTPSNSRIAYVGMGTATQPGTYQVDVTVVPEAATITAPNSIATTLGIDETLSFTVGSSSFQVQLTSDLTLEQIVDALNQAFEDESAGLTASMSGTDLVISSDAVGDAASFSVTSDVTGAGTGIGTDGLSDTGVSVAGTLTNTATSEVYTTTGSGSLLTVEDGDAEGLKLSFSGTTTGDYGTVTVTVGFAEQLKRVLTTFTDSLEGPIKTAVDGYNSDIKELRKDIESIQLRLSQRESYLIQQFSKANEALAQMQYLQASLSRQLAGLR